MKVGVEDRLCLGGKTGVNTVQENSDVSSDTRVSGTALLQTGHELVKGKNTKLVQKVKDIITQFVYNTDEPLAINFSDYLSERLGYDYTYLANLFSETQGITIEGFLIRNKIERVKKLLSGSDLQLTEIALLLHYSSAAHLSAQFKKVTGFTPSHFKATRKKGEILQSRGNVS